MLSLIFSFILNAQAATPFHEELGSYFRACNQYQVHPEIQIKTIYDLKNRKSFIDRQLFTKLSEIAKDLAQVWGDTILEGPYYADGNTFILKVDKIFKRRSFAGYRITYAEKAWYTDSCQFNGDKSTLKGCQEGQIVEQSFVSPDLKDYFTDECNFASFVQ